MINRLCTALHKTEDEVRAMRFKRAQSLFAYWERHPPEHIALGILAKALTTWEPPEKADGGGRFRESTQEELLAFAAEAGIPIVQNPRSPDGE